MATWREMAVANREAAKELLLRKQYRSSISRSYYAAYCAVTGLLAGSITFGYGGNNPTHTELPKFILSNLGGVEQHNRRKIRRAILQLFKLRTDADYVPAALVRLDEAREALHDLGQIFRILEMDDE